MSTPKTAAEWRAYRLAHLEHLRTYKREYDRKRYRTHSKDELARRRRWSVANPEKQRAIWQANHAVQSGKLLRQACEVCGEPRAEKHHDDYDKPLEVRWLCKPHHRGADALRKSNGVAAKSTTQEVALSQASPLLPQSP